MRALGKQVMGDRFFLWSHRLFVRPYFQMGVDSPNISEHLSTMVVPSLDLPEFGEIQTSITTTEGVFEPSVATNLKAGPSQPLVIFHLEGTGPQSFSILNQIFPSPRKLGINLIGVRAPLMGSRRDFRTATASFANYVAVLATTIGLTERLLDTSAASEAPCVAVLGIGQGGYVANWHHQLYDTADLYMPLLAGTAMGDALVSAFPLARTARRARDSIRETLNFEADWQERSHPNVFPVLGSADLISRFDRQSVSYGDTPIEVWPTGHTTIEQHSDRIRDKLVNELARVQVNTRLSA